MPTGGGAVLPMMLGRAKLQTTKANSKLTGPVHLRLGQSRAAAGSDKKLELISAAEVIGATTVSRTQPVEQLFSLR